MVGHSLAIDRFDTHLRLVGAREDGGSLRQEVGRTVGQVLPDAIATALEPLLGGRDGVLRIDRVALKLRLSRGELSAFRLANLMALEIARAVVERAESGEGGASVGFAYWPDHTSFAASYLALRLRLSPAPEWAFPDFAPLQHLAPHEAAFELIVSRPAILVALARLVGLAGIAAAVGKLPEQTAAALVDRLAASPLSQLNGEAEATVIRMLEASGVETIPSPWRAVLAAVMRSTATGGVAAVRADIRTMARLARLAVTLAVTRQALEAVLGRPPTAGDFSPAGIALLPAPLRSAAETVLGPFIATKAGRQQLVRLLQGAPPSYGPADRAADATPASAAEPTRVIASRLAGIGLLLPSVLTHGLHRQLDPAALHLTLVAAAGPEADAAARLDPLLAALAPFDPRDPEPAFPPVPAALRAIVPASQQEGDATAEGARAWAACLTHDFAAGLAGFEASSLPYLRSQFLLRPGHLQVTGERLTLQLDAMPLGVLLRIAGLNGWTGQLLQGRLRIDIAEI